MTQHINSRFDRDLEAIRSQVLQMAGLVESHIRSAVAGYIESDPAQADAAIAGDARVNELELAIDSELGQVIVRRQPAASDLRLILAASKIVTDLERIGDEATKIARIGKEIAGDKAAHAPRLAGVKHLSEVALGMLHRALDAFARLDASAAARVCGEDAAIDEEFRAMLRELITFMMEDPRTIGAALQVVWVAKAIERIGDHSRNIAEYVIYIVQGSDVRHRPLAELEREALGG
jgi:phosphate transport system protein